MKQTALLFLFLLGMMQPVSTQTYSSVTSDQEIYTFLDWMAENDSKTEKTFEKKTRKLSARIIPWKETNFVSRYKTDELEYLEIEEDYLLKRSNGGVDTLFTSEDKQFIRDQFYAINKDNILWKKNIGGKKPEKPGKEGDGNLRYYSIPLFSLNKEYAIIYKGYDCGYRCISGRYALYKKVSGRWMFAFPIQINDDFYFEE